MRSSSSSWALTRLYSSEMSKELAEEAQVTPPPYRARITCTYICPSCLTSSLLKYRGEFCDCVGILSVWPPESFKMIRTPSLVADSQETFCSLTGPFISHLLCQQQSSFLPETILGRGKLLLCSLYAKCSLCSGIIFLNPLDFLYSSILLNTVVEFGYTSPRWGLSAALWTLNSLSFLRQYL